MALHPLNSLSQEFYNQMCEDFNFACPLFNKKYLTEDQVSVFNQLNDEIKNRYYGAGLIFPENLEGKRVLDIGCGSGSLVFILSKFVGPNGFVVGVDLCDGLVSTAKSQIDYHTKLWGYDKPNVEFYVGNGERLGDLNIEANSFDIIVSSGSICVIPDKDAVFSSAFALLKEGGQFYLADLYADKDLPPEQRENTEMWCYGLPGALRWDTLASVAERAGFTTPYLTQVNPHSLPKEEFRTMLGNVRYVTASCRLFKLPKGWKRDASRVIYNGTVSRHPESFQWDVDITFKTGEALDVDSELASILSGCYLKDCFTFAETMTKVLTNRNQNPFAYLDQLQSEESLLETSAGE